MILAAISILVSQSPLQEQATLPVAERLRQCVVRAAAEQDAGRLSPSLIAQQAWDGCPREIENMRGFLEFLAPLAWGASSEAEQNRRRFVQERMDRIEARYLALAEETVRLTREQRTARATD